MNTAKIFETGRSQAVRLPKEFRFDADEVFINKIGDIVMLIPKDYKWAGFLSSFSMFTEDFMNFERESQNLQERDTL
ncbi:MAG: AbrB/MazE/SpoVT family DNA-binding domain-containing protein [Lachnospiraceae bacterium]|nr:AbrB/MazE/SpoVT family DNA-binding domain-containing protein [Lachnospiraceae bacterium]